PYIAQTTPTSTLFPYTTLFRSREHLIRLGWTPPDEHALSQPAEQRAEIDALRAEVERWKGQHMRDSAELRRLCQHRDEYKARAEDRKSTRLNSSHVKISYAVFC